MSLNERILWVDGVASYCPAFPIVVEPEESPCNAVRRLYTHITQLTDLKPSPNVNGLFSELVEWVIKYPQLEHDLTLDEMTLFQKRCGEAEGELEGNSARRIRSSWRPLKTLQEFPYYQNYEKITGVEWEVATRFIQPKTAVFVGGGPLPLTGILLAKDYGAKVTVLDQDPEAVDLSQAVIKKIGLSDSIKVEQISGEKYQDYSQFDLISVAALAGGDRFSKQKIFEVVRDQMKQSSIILARSSTGSRELLYRALDSEIYQRFHLLAEVHPQNDIINSVVAFSKL